MDPTSVHYLTEALPSLELQEPGMRVTKDGTEGDLNHRDQWDHRAIQVGVTETARAHEG